jgi:hypothetical protein
MLVRAQQNCSKFIRSTFLSTISVLVCCCTGIFAFPFSITLKKGIVQRLALERESSNQGRDARNFDTYKLGLTPYIPKNEKNQNNHGESLMQRDDNQTFHSNLTSQEPLSYLHLLQLPDREQAAVVQNGTKQTKLPKSLFIDDWMMQLPSKWAAFVSEGDNKDHRFSNIFALPSSNNVSRNFDTKTSNVNSINRPGEDDTDGIGTFESSDDFNALWDAVFNKTIPHKQSQPNVVGQNKSKIARVSTQPQSIFSSNINDPRKNTTTNTGTLKKVSISKPHYQHPLLLGKDPTASITVADLDAILRYNNYYARSSTLPIDQELQRPDGKKSLVSSSSKLNKGGVAFPQPTALSAGSVKWGATVSGGMMGMLLAVSGAPNLWLVGILCGSVFGYETTKRLPANDFTSTELNVVQSMVIYLGRGLATMALKAYDTLQAFFFMYKTGQLSYEYYKSYAALDKRLSIQKKIDAWNSRFVEGKLAFDRWEKENEVGRKVLAGLRTVWLVGEQNVRKRSGLLRRSQRYQSRYRVIQFLYDALYTFTKLCESIWNLIVQGEISSEIRNFVRGTFRDDGGKLSLTQSQLRGVFLSIVTVSIIGALFTISPVILSVVAAALGFIWPTWFSEMMNRTGTFFDDTVTRGRGNMSKIKTKERHQISFKRHDKNRYHYYRTADGKKRYYRVGEPWIFTPFHQRNTPPKKGPLAWIFNNG